ncbi:autotransporter outer membrane beta-barrel domain-containing protein [Falsiroseomonas oryzae]|uniref:autotransporter outer membrane beta-barrel domain-containing protein n=1 Tax=Falsiroseomonas oryzae TaxID=2766473 RepID=UPI0022EAA814|nr:autotransporter outer membrane beta-barrel domain-containing protein [Roseomonas sp. MO-31]
MDANGEVGARPVIRARMALAAGLPLWLGGAALANDACTPISGTTVYQCAGNQAAGITFTGVSSPAGTVPTNATGFVATSLSANIGGSVAATLAAGDARGFAISFSDPTHLIFLSNGTATGVLMSATGQSTRSWSSSATPLPVLAVTLNSPVLAGSATLPAVSLIASGRTGSGGSDSDGGRGSDGYMTRDLQLTLGATVNGQPPAGGYVQIVQAITTSGAAAVSVQSTGGRGGSGGNGPIDGGGGGTGAPGGVVSVIGNTSWVVAGNQTALLALSSGGSGGGGGYGALGSGGNGGTGGAGQGVTFTAQPGTTFEVATTLDSGPGIQLISEGGNGGTGGAGETFSSGGRGGAGGYAGAVTATLGTVQITTQGSNSAGLGAFSLGGVGGNGGNGGFFTGGGGSGGDSGTARDVSVTVAGGRIETAGADSPGLIAHSTAGHGGAAGNNYGFVAFSAAGGSAGAGGSVYVQSNAAIRTMSGSSPAIAAQSAGGGGGTGGGGFGAFFAQGSAGGNGGFAGNVTVFSSGSLTTSGPDSPAVYAQSIGGAGGNGGNAGSVIAAVGGKGSQASPAGSVTVSVSGTIVTGAAPTGPIVASENPGCGVGCSRGIVAQSIGGGGGHGGSTGGWFSVGGTGGGGGNGGPVSVGLALGSITTYLTQSDGILAQSLGGGGGAGGMAAGSGGWVSAAVGGAGGDGGDGQQAVVSLAAVGASQPSVTTFGSQSPGITVQSIGGGGGHGGFAVDVAPGIYAAASVAIGGSGGNGGSGGTASYTNQSDPQYCCSFVTTSGDKSPGVTVQSIGGGGGRGGFALSFAGSDGVSGTFAMGGSGGNGGHGSTASAWSNTTIRTQGADSAGLTVQSIGGGGGVGGFSVAGTLNLGVGGLAVAVGGGGGGGGSSDTVAVVSSAPILTAGARSDGLLAQSLGGGGGNAGFAASGTFGLNPGANFGVSVGASGGTGGSAGTVVVTNTANISATGPNSRALVAQSVGGGGGAGSVAVSAAVNLVSGTTGGGITAAVALGGNGGSAGDGRPVSVTNTGDLITSSPANAALGTDSGGQGILAQSIGGGGGAGGWAGMLSMTASYGGALSVGAAMGGAGGSGGNASTVSVAHTGAITTWGPSSEAILAQSQGGGGGNAGGIASITAAASPGGSIAGSINIGQSGGGGGTADAVTVTSTGTLTTHGAQSAAISAQSHGGGGGNAGYIANINVATGSSSMAAVFGITAGGSGGVGRAGGNVTVNADGQIVTLADKSPGIIAQSLGGGGGNAAYTVSLSLSDPTSNLTSIGLTGAVGGNGGTGATSGAVSVTNTAAISTGQAPANAGDAPSGSASHGILAQSIGGGGGSAALTLVTAALTTAKATVTVGGVGGSGADGNTVTVTNHGSITLQGNAAAGIIARSIGGGGGASQATSVGVGASSSIFTNKAGTIQVSVGNQGAGGGNGRDVTVTNTGAISTATTPSSTPPPTTVPTGYQSPVGSYGILAQSVGGGGGTGGAASLLVPSFIAQGSSFNISVAVGGAGGDGGTSGTVQVTNSGFIRTWQTEAFGIVAQSVGGGGGRGGASTSVSSFLYNNSNVANIAVAVGGQGGPGNDAGAVSVQNTGQVNTFGTSAHAIFAQSVGGGGGDGGSAAAYALGVNQPSLSTFQASLNVAVGGMGGGSGRGGAVTVSNAATLKTAADDAIGIFAQSVGGGGGTGGGGSQATTFPLTTLAVTVGGKGGVGGDGGAVLVTHTDWGLLTAGANAPAIYAQSVGGGGGRGGVGLYTPLVNLPFGGAGGSAGNGGTVNVYVAYASVATAGSGRAYGIFAQSVGGGGGEAGGTGVGLIDTVYPAKAPSLSTGVSPGAVAGSGSGGAVQVTLEAARVTTTGSDAIGVFAQSVGGGGGVSGQTATSCTTSPCGYSVGSTGGTGSAGNVGVALTNGAQVATTGQYSHAIFAQSAGGNVSQAGSVTVSVSGSVSASGDGASGIFANSFAGDGGSGPMNITVLADGSVSGGSGNAAAIRLVDGSANTVTNAGTITSVGGTSGVALRADRSVADPFGTVVTTVTNTGLIVGQMEAGDGARISVANQPGGTLATGPRLILGAGGMLRNAGTLEVGGARRVGETRLVGDLLQVHGGRMVMDLVPPRRDRATTADSLVVVGSARLAGDLVVRLADLGQAGLGRQRVTLLRSTGPLDFGELSVTPSAVAQYRLESGSIALSYEVDFANATVAAGLRPAQFAMASHLATLHGADAVPASLFYLLDAGTTEAYGLALDRLSPEAYAANLWTATLAATRFAGTMLDCRGRSAAERLVLGEACVAAGFTGWRYGRENDASTLGYTQDSLSFVLNAERQLTEVWALGGGVGYDSLSARASGRLWTARGEMFQAGLFARRSFGDLSLTAAIHGGVVSLATRRYTTETSQANGDAGIGQAGGMLRAEQALAAAGGTLRLRLDLNAVHAWSGSLTETGGVGRLQVGAVSETAVALRPGVEWSTSFERAGHVVRPRLGLALTQYLSDPSPLATASFVETGPVVPPMRVRSTVPSSWADALIGVEVANAAGLVVGASLYGQVADGAYQLGGAVQLRAPF